MYSYENKEIHKLTYYVLSNVPTDHTYFISVSSENVIGEGDDDTIYGNVLL